MLDNPNGQQKPIMAQLEQSLYQHEFLPLCDVIFNIISLASYFCDVVFDLAMGYALANHPMAPQFFFPLTIVFVVVSLIISQIVSIRWYLWGARGKLTVATQESASHRNKKIFNWSVWCVIALHATQVGVLWRYFKLFIPVDLTYVKHEVRELCVLRLIHAFCEAGPMLLLQTYLLSIGIDNNLMKNERDELEETSIIESDKLRELTAVSAGLSLWSVCWAVASFSKGAARLRNLERLVLTWLGVLTQLSWRLGTVSARIGALVAWASLYGGQWLIIVLLLHWLSMLMWLLLTPDGLFHSGERLSFARKSFLASLLAFVYVFAYINLHETNHRQKMVIFYTVMFLENCLLMGVWAVGVNENGLRFPIRQTRPMSLVLILNALFFGGLFFMGLYYRFFHVRRLRFEAGGRMNENSATTTLSNADTREEKSMTFDNRKLSNGLNINNQRSKLSNSGIPGVFNCRFANPTVANLNRKKKKPTTFVPPPPPPHALEDTKHWSNSSNNTKQLIPFWKRPLSLSITENYKDDRSIRRRELNKPIGSSLNINLIREKLREKKQQQLRELRAIQEEMREGKLVPPSASTSSLSSSISMTNQQPPPNIKLHTSPETAISPSSSRDTISNEITSSAWPPVKMHCLLPPSPPISFPSAVHTSSHWQSLPQHERHNNSEILLAPRCLALPSPHHYPHWTVEHSHNEEDESSQNEHIQCEENTSEVEGSQLSLPKSYTLPREFKYTNENNSTKERRICANQSHSSRIFFQPSNNSSDGDVDSADNDEETDIELQTRMGNLHCLNQEGDYQQRYKFENNQETERSDAMVNDGSSPNRLNCYVDNSYGTKNINHLFKMKVKHETKL